MCPLRPPGPRRTLERMGRPPPPRRRATIAATALTALAACGSSTAAGAPAGSIDLTVLAASSLVAVLPRLDAAYTAANPGITATPDFDGTQALLTRLENAPESADVFISADTSHMDKAVAMHLVETPKTVARNRLVVAVPQGNPAHVTGLADLGRSGVRVVLADPSVPAGSLALNTAMTAERTGDVPAGFRSRLDANTVSRETSVRAVLQKVEGGEVDAGIVYATDARSAGDVEAVAIPDRDQTLATYLAAVVVEAPHPAAAGVYLDNLVGAPAQRAFQDAGFLAPA